MFFSLVRNRRQLISDVTISIAIVAVYLMALPAMAEVKFNGFATIAVTTHSNDDILYRSSLVNRPRTSPSLAPDSVLGGQINYYINDRWDAVAQVVIQDRADTAISNYLEMGFLRYRPTRNWAFKFGRVNSNLYMLSEYKPVGYAQVWARPPLEFYSNASVVSNVDGIEVVHSQNIGDGFLELGIIAGQSQPRLKGSDGKLRANFKELISLSARYTWNEWQFKSTYARGRVDNPQIPQFDLFEQAVAAVPSELLPQKSELLSRFSGDGDIIKYLAGGMKYDGERWNVQAEAGSVDVDWLLFTSLRFGYVSVAYYMDEFSPFLAVSGAQSKDKEFRFSIPSFPAGTPPELAAGIVGLITGSNANISDLLVDQYSLSAGVNWHFYPSWVAKAQLDHIRMDNPGTGLFGNNALIDDVGQERMNVFTLSVSTVF
ncbi:hypothetical protein [Alteromonas sp. H39]|uniref:hypothetical protein n=1 Tax=Alteromonas sp. H39 TaxID=3389876 RepID=UPI0039E1D96A